MPQFRLNISLILILFLSVISLYAQDNDEAKAPDPDREFRAAWVATVANINWPSEPGLSTDQQRKEAIGILDSLEALNFNAVVFQVRPQGDALYESELEPWSYYLTGEMGKAPDPFYDPLTFWIEEAHKRGMELHAWLNPYRVHHVKAPKPNEHSVIHELSEEVVELEEGYLWLDPTKQKTQDHTKKVVKDILLRYDVDGIHFDDYFYPYKSYNNNEDFPDTESWRAYKQEGGTLSRSDWRRNAVNEFVRNTYYMIKSYKPFVKFGLSPFGIWRPGHPSSIKGMDQYNDLYADAKLWLNNGWLDYIAPQLYWSTRDTEQSYPVLLKWWEEQNTHDKYIWPGINDYKMTNDNRGADELESQIMINRAIANNGPGVTHWSVDALLEKDELQKRLKDKAYHKPAIIPPLDYVSTEPNLDKPNTSLKDEGDELRVSWQPLYDDLSNFTLVQIRYGDLWLNKTVGQESLIIPKKRNGKFLNKIKSAHIDRFGMLGKFDELEVD